MHETTQEKCTVGDGEGGYRRGRSAVGPLPLPYTPSHVTSAYTPIDKNWGGDPEGLPRAVMRPLGISGTCRDSWAVGNGREHGEGKEHLYLPKNPRRYS